MTSINKKLFGRRLRKVVFSAQELEFLEQALNGGNPAFSREWAADALRKSRYGGQLLIRTINASGPLVIRRAAVYGFLFGRISSAEFNLLLRVFRDVSEDPSVRGQAAEVLGSRVNYGRRARCLRRRDAVARSAFLQGLEDPAPEVRFWSIYALADPDNTWVIPKLEEMTHDCAVVPSMWTVGQEARWAILRIRDQDPDFVDPATL